MMIRHACCLLFLVMACPGQTFADAPAAVIDPTAPVAIIQAALDAATQQAELASRHDALTTAVEQSFDLTSASRLILRSAWKDLDARQQAAFADALGPLIAANFASRFKPGVAASFDEVTVNDLPRGRAQVQTRLLRDNGDPVVFDYLVQQRSGQWRIVNIVVGGVSEIALRSAQYTRQLDDQGFAAVLDNMRAETDAALGNQSKK